jgi:hypothetical protein
VAPQEGLGVWIVEVADGDGRAQLSTATRPVRRGSLTSQLRTELTLLPYVMPGTMSGV